MPDGGGGRGEGMMSEPALRELQQWMKARIKDASSSGHSMLLNPQRGTPGEARLAVYASGYVIRIREALAEVYEAVRHVLGEPAFAALAAAYADRHPSRDYNLSLAGRSLPEFLRAHPLTAELPFLPDLARLEWEIAQAFHAFDGPPCSSAALAGVPLEAWERAWLVFQPSVRVVASAWPILELWQARLQPREQIALEVVDRPQTVLVFRQDMRVVCELVDQRQARALERLLAGQPLGSVCRALAAEPDAPMGDWCAAWMRRGLIIDVR